MGFGKYTKGCGRIMSDGSSCGYEEIATKNIVLCVDCIEKQRMAEPEGENLTQLGSKSTSYRYDNPTSDILEVFDNKAKNRMYSIEFVTEEFTSLCPKTGQPDFAEVKIVYTPKEKCIETKSLKMYLFSYRNHGAFMETITNKILDDCVKACDPQIMNVTCEFKIRGGIKLVVYADHYDYEYGSSSPERATNAKHAGGCDCANGCNGDCDGTKEGKG